MHINLILLICICVFLFVISWQDFKAREVTVALFVLLFITTLLLQYSRCGFTQEFYLHLAFNFSIISIQLIVVYVYLKVFRKINFFDGMGLGDIFLYICLIPLMSVPVFLMYNIASLISVLLVYISLGKKIKMQADAIPLAGIQSVFLLIGIIFIEGVLSIPFLGTCFWF